MEDNVCTKKARTEKEASDLFFVNFPRFMIAAPSSGAGKTMITCGLLALLSETGKEVKAFKCGPDYIDPMFHRRVLGIPSYNLDSFLSDKNTLKFLLGRHGENKANRDGQQNEAQGRQQRQEKIGVLEGVMGYYDGLGGVRDQASSYDVAKLTKTPVILVADASGASLSVLATIKGFLNFRRNSRICGVLFNRMSPSMYPALKKLTEEELGIPVVGYVPGFKDFSWESRHLGLIMPEEIEAFREQVQLLADRMRPTIDLDAVFRIAGGAEPVSWIPFAIPFVKKKDGTAPVIAVAMDQAFCFYYQDNLELLERMGAKLVFFSPIRDQKLPMEADGLYLGGGYPELFAKELSENNSMRESIRSALNAGLPCIAECGGFLYLQERLLDQEGTAWEMAGYLKGTGTYAGKLTRFGYVTLESRNAMFFGEKKFPAHEFHYWDSDKNGSGFLVVKPVTGRSWECGYGDLHFYGGFPHLHFYSCSPYGFLRAAAVWKRERIEWKREWKKPN